MRASPSRPRPRLRPSLGPAGRPSASLMRDRDGLERDHAREGERAHESFGSRRALAALLLVEHDLLDKEHRCQVSHENQSHTKGSSAPSDSASSALPANGPRHGPRDGVARVFELNASECRHQPPRVEAVAWLASPARVAIPRGILVKHEIAPVLSLSAIRHETGVSDSTQKESSAPSDSASSALPASGPRHGPQAGVTPQDTSSHPECRIRSKAVADLASRSRSRAEST
jgi:hypothetical protein